MPNKHSRLEDHHVYDDDLYGFVQDKLVISQAPPFKVPPTPLSNKISPSPLELSFSSKSASTIFTASKSSASSSVISSASSCSSSSLSTASSAPSLTSKERSFSNDFLLSCIKENPHVLRINNSVKAGDYPVLSSPDIIHARGVGSPARPPIPSPARPSIPQKMPALQGPTVQKRVRSSSPNLTRQKTMRVAEPDSSACSQSLSSRVLRSPSPSRRFEGGDKKRGTLATSTREVIGNRTRPVAANEESNSVCSTSPSMVRRKEHIRPASPNRNPITTRLRECAMSSESFAHQIGAKVEEIASKFSSPGDDVDSADDINNPLISLDCFIFL
ncbi:hypothetical protein CDL15_Pgr027921 [Punica granatum]|nr:hypothetical protein CDL15_Pgr027921 [Punica granatum]